MSTTSLEFAKACNNVLQIPVSPEQEDISSRGANSDSYSFDSYNICGQHYAALPGQAG